MLYPPRISVLFLLAWLAGCGSPKTHARSQEAVDGPTAAFGRPAVLARNEGEAHMLQGRKPMWIKVDPQTLGSRTLTVGMEDMPPGDSIGVHKHLQEDEVVFVHRGEVEVTATIVFAFNVPGFEKCLRLLSAPAGTTFVSPPAAVVAAARRECHQVRRADETH